jgi:heme/copper-type cytochrome/quinol oxidase subunit 4
MGKWDMMRIVWLLLKACIFFVLSTALTMIAFVCTVAYMRNKELTTFFEVHGLTVILGVQLVLYNVLNISVFLKIFRK